MTTEKLNYIYNYVIDDIEYSESVAIEHAINNLFKCDKIAVGNQSGMDNLSNVSGCIKVIEIDFEYHKSICKDAPIVYDARGIATLR